MCALKFYLEKMVRFSVSCSLNVTMHLAYFKKSDDKILKRSITLYCFIQLKDARDNLYVDHHV